MRIYESKILMCDDSATNIAILKRYLKDMGYEDIDSTIDPRKVTSMLRDKDYDILLLDLEMPHLNGFEVIELVRKEFSEDFFPILMLTGHKLDDIRKKAFELGANDFVSKPFDQVELMIRMKNLLDVRASFRLQKQLNTELEKRVRIRTRELEAAAEDLLKKLGQAGEYKDDQTGLHVARVSKLSRILAEAADLPKFLCDLIESTAPMHDIGKIGIRDEVLLKPGKLTAEERSYMEAHVEIGGNLLENNASSAVQMARSIALSHHEKWDGSGYPRGLSGESIPLEGRIVAIADVFDALTSERPYKSAWEFDKAANFIAEQAGKHFDPELCRLFDQEKEKIRSVLLSHIE